MKPNNIDFNCMENKTKTFFKISPFLVHGRKSFRSYSLSIFGWTIPLFLFCDSVLFGLVAIKVVLFFQILGKKTLSSLMMVTVQHVQIFFMRLSSVAPLSMCSSFPLQPQRLHLSSESLSGDKAYTSLLYLHPPSFSLPLHPSPRFSIPYIHMFSLPRLSMKWTQSLYSDWLELNWIGRMLSLSLSHTHTRTLTHSRSRKQTDSVSPTAPCQAGTRTCMRCRAHTHRRTNTLSVIVNPVASTLGWGDVLG